MPGHADTVAPPEEARPRRDGAPRTKRPWSKGWFTTVCAVVAFLVSAVGLFWDFLPQYRPDPLDSVGADVSVVAVQPQVRLVDWLELTHGPDPRGEAKEIFGRTPTFSELAQRGELIYVRTQVDGHKHKDVALAYALYDGETQTPVHLPVPPELAKLQRITLDAPSERSVQLLWAPDLSLEENAFIRVELRSNHGLLAVADSAPLHRGGLAR
jgi:hypothetical protein